MMFFFLKIFLHLLNLNKIKSNIFWQPNFSNFLQSLYFYSSPLNKRYISPKIELILFQFYSIPRTIKKNRERERKRKKEKIGENNEEKQTFQKLWNVPELWNSWRSFKGRRDKVFRNGNSREIAYSFHTRTASKKTANQIDSSSGICSWIRSRYRVGVSFVGQPLEIFFGSCRLTMNGPFCKWDSMTWQKSGARPILLAWRNTDRIGTWTRVQFVALLRSTSLSFPHRWLSFCIGDTRDTISTWVGTGENKIRERSDSLLELKYSFYVSLGIETLGLI